MLKIYIICRFLPSAGLPNRRILSSMVLICESCKIILRNFVWSSSTFSSLLLSFDSMILNAIACLLASCDRSVPQTCHLRLRSFLRDTPLTQQMSPAFPTSHIVLRQMSSVPKFSWALFLSPCGDLLFRFWKAKNTFVLITYAVVFSLKIGLPQQR